MGLQRIENANYYDFIWDSPPCTHYSIARTTAKTPRDFEGADAIVAKTLEIIEYFDPPLWLMENPQTGYLKTRPVVAGIPHQDVTSCKYAYLYKEQTRLWGTFPFALRPPCTRHDPCEFLENGRHPHLAQRYGVRGQTQQQLFTIPPDLCGQIALYATSWLESHNVEHNV